MKDEFVAMMEREMLVDIICNGCKKFIETVEKDSFDFYKKDYCEKCKNDFNKSKESK